MNKDTIIIFQQPELYFFPHYKELVFSPFGISEKSIWYILYKILYVLHIPLYPIFWGKWKKEIKTAKQVIIFDYGYQYGMEKYIKKRNPSCRVSLFFWNIITKDRKNHLLFSDRSSIYSTDKNDCQTYHFKYNHMFYPKEFYKPYSPEGRNRLFFLGVDKGRAKELFYLYQIFHDCNIEADIRLIPDRRTKNMQYIEIYTSGRLTYKSYLKEIRHAGILLDITQKGQVALTMRVVESIFFSKKLITNNQAIKDYDFYDENNIFILPENIENTSAEQIQAFLEKPFHPYQETILEKYSFEHWKSQFISMV